MLIGRFDLSGVGEMQFCWWFSRSNKQFRNCLIKVGSIYWCYAKLMTRILMLFGTEFLLLSSPVVACVVFRHASVSSTYPCKLVSWLVGHTFGFPISGHGRSNKKSSKNKVHLFSNFASGRTLPTHENVYEGLNALKCIWRLKCSKM